MIFDEAQRAWDAEKVRAHHKDAKALSEPASFVQFAERVPSWCVVLGLVGDGQEIHSGEENGISLWADAVVASKDQWEVVGPSRFRSEFEKRRVHFRVSDELHLSRSVRFHFAAGLSDWAAGVIEKQHPASELAKSAESLLGQKMLDLGCWFRVATETWLLTESSHRTIAFSSLGRGILSPKNHRTHAAAYRNRSPSSRRKDSSLITLLWFGARIS